MKRSKAKDWDGKTYGHYGYGHAHPCVKDIQCSRCGAKAGKLCIGDLRKKPRFQTHYVRRYLWKAS